ncbi:MAG: lysophospholipid acyltransferase family protein [Patescibacteria group bacterium]
MNTKTVKITQTLTYILFWPILYVFGSRLDSSRTSNSATIIACNHVSVLDFLAVPGSIRFRNYLSSSTYYFMTANRFLNTPITGWALLANGGFRAKPHRNSLVGVERAVEILKHRGNVIMFPEGGFPINGKPRAARPGIEKIIDQTSAKVLPVFIEKSKLGPLTRVRTTVGQRFNANGMSAKQIMDKVYSIKRV